MHLVGNWPTTDLTQLTAPALTALADLDVNVVAALGREVDALSVTVPANARVAEYIPFDVLLPKADAYITNGGAGGIHQALAAGVPGRRRRSDRGQARERRTARAPGLGIDLQTATPIPEALTAAMERLLKDTEIRDDVQRLTQVYAAHDAHAEIERLALD